MVEELKIINPSAGLLILFLCVTFILGGKKPCVVLDISNFADAFGVAVPIAALFTLTKLWLFKLTAPVAPV